MKSTIEYNDRLEIKFDSIPDPNTRANLKRRGFYWDPRKTCWWLARPVSLKFVRNEPICQDGFEYALDYCRQLGLTDGQAQDIRKKHQFRIQQLAEQGMEEACGIA